MEEYPPEYPDNSTPDSTVSFDTDDESTKEPACKPSPRLQSKESDKPIIDSTSLYRSDSDESSSSSARGILGLRLQHPGDRTQSRSKIGKASASDLLPLIDPSIVDANESTKEPACKPSPRLQSKESDKPIIDSTSLYRSDSDESSSSSARGILGLRLQHPGDRTQSRSKIGKASASDLLPLIDPSIVDANDVSLSEVERDFYEHLSPARVKRDASGKEKESPTTDKPSIESTLRVERNELCISDETSEATSKELERLSIESSGKETVSPSTSACLPHVDLTFMFDSDDPDGSPRKRLRDRGKSLPDPSLPQIDLTPRFSLDGESDEEQANPKNEHL